MKDKGDIFCSLKHLAKKRGLKVSFFPFDYYNGRLKGDHIGIRQTMETIDEYNYSLAHEIAHYFLHYDKGNTITGERHEEYEEQTGRQKCF